MLLNLLLQFQLLQLIVKIFLLFKLTPSHSAATFDLALALALADNSAITLEARAIEFVR